VGSAGGLWTSVALAFVTTVLIARSLGPERYGAVALAMAVVAIVTALLDVPLDDALVHYGYRASATGADRSVRRIVRRGIVTDVGVGALVAIVLIALAGPAAEISSGGWLNASLIRLAAVEALARTMDGSTGAILMIAGRPDLRAWVMAVASALRLILVGSAAAMTGNAEVVLAIWILATALSSLVLGVVAWRVGWRQWTAQRVAEQTEPSISMLLRFAAQSALSTTVSGTRNGLVPVLLARLSGPSAVAFFEVATFPLQAADTVSAPVRLALLPEQARLAAERRTADLRDTVRAYIRVAVLIGVPGAIAGWLVLPWLLPTLYTVTYSPAVWPARILTTAALLSLVLGWAKTLPAAIGKPGVRTAVLTADAVLVLGALALLGGRGASGAAIAIVAGLTAQALAWSWLTPRLLRSAPERLLPEPDSTAAAWEDLRR
jgi:O-antigen/teichoic acid export membrane protein